MQRRQWRRRWAGRLGEQGERLASTLAPTVAEVPTHDPQAIAFFRFVKPLLRGTGFTLVAIFVLWLFVNAAPFPLANQREGVLWAEEVLNRSSLLVVGVLLVLLSLVDYQPSWLAATVAAEPRDLPDRAPRRVGRRDGLLLRLRPLLLVVVLAYLALAAYVPVANQTTRVMGLQALDLEYGGVKENLTKLQADVDRSTGPYASKELIAKYPQLQASPVRPLPLTLLRQQITEAKEMARRTYARKRADGDRDILLRNVRLGGQGVVFALLFLAFWRRWPAYPRALEQGEPLAELVGETLDTHPIP